MPRAPIRRRQLNRNGPAPRNNNKIPNSSPAKAELAKKLASKPVGPRPNDSDDSDRLVVKGSGRRGRYVPKQEIYASGAVGKGDKPGNFPTRAQRRKSLTEATKEILANGQKKAEKGTDASSSTVNKQQPVKDNAPLVNGIIHESGITTTKDAAPSPPLVPSSIIKAPGTAVRSAQPTPTRENSILGALKPRRRQPSILQNLGQDSSSFDLDDEADFLPDDESTPPTHLNLHTVPTPDLSSPALSSSRKRKLGASEPVASTQKDSVPQPSSSPLPTAKSPSVPEPSLPAMPVSALRERGRKQRESLGNDSDILALPQSSSSAPTSPAKTKAPIAITTKTRKQTTKPLPSMSTKELQATMMPSKRQRTVRERTRNRDDFDIPADSNSEPDEHDDSVFLPPKKGRKTRRKEPLKSRETKTKVAAKSNAESGNVRALAVATGRKPKQSTNHLTVTATEAPLLTPSASTTVSATNRETKSPSQSRSATSVTDITTNTSSHSQLVVKAKGTRSAGKQSGGSRLIGKGTVDKEADKENLDVQSSSDVDHEGGGRVGKRQAQPAKRGKWADIDAWDMEFEEVEVISGSGNSSPTRR